MKLIDIYIQEVTRRLPEKSRADISLELQSTIEDMLPDDYDEQDVKEVLTELGDPAVLARGYRDWPQHLIGPRYFDGYMTILKLGLSFSTAIALIAYLAQQVAGFTGEESILRLLPAIIIGAAGSVIEVAMHVFFWTTLCFAIAERFDSAKDGQPFHKWSPDDLKDLPDRAKERLISKVEVYGGIFWTAVWATGYFYADHLVGIYENRGDGLQFVTPIFNQDVLQLFMPVVLVIIAMELALSVLKLYTTKWTMRLAAFNTFLQIISTSVFIMILTRSDMFDSGFITYMDKVFNNGWESWLVNGAMIMFLLGAAYNIYDGFRRAAKH
jgi:hypothetical protein